MYDTARGQTAISIYRSHVTLFTQASYWAHLSGQINRFLQQKILAGGLLSRKRHPVLQVCQYIGISASGQHHGLSHRGFEYLALRQQADVWLSTLTQNQYVTLLPLNNQSSIESSWVGQVFMGAKVRLEAGWALGKKFFHIAKLVRKVLLHELFAKQTSSKKFCGRYR